MKANVLWAAGDLRFQEYEEPIVCKGWVKVKVRASGICGSDVARILKTGTYNFPTIPGHEFSGEVCEVFDCDEYLLGQRVSVFPLIPCMECDSCRVGRYETCSNYNYLGSRTDGGFAEYVLVPKWNLLKLPDTVSFSSAAMFEPASVALHALRKVGVEIGDTVVIIGPGTIGCILAQLCQIAGAKQVIMVGRSQSKLDFAALHFGVKTINSTNEDVIKLVDIFTNSKGVDVVVEGTGVGNVLDMCFDIVKNSGRVLLMGNPLGDMNLSKTNYWKVLRKQLSLYGTWNSTFGIQNSDWETILSLVANGKLHLEELITHRLNLGDLMKGLEIIQDHNIYSNKVMLFNE